MTVTELTEYLIELQQRPEGKSEAAKHARSGASARSPADHRGVRAAAVPVHVHGTEVFLPPNIYTTFLSTLPPLILLAVGLTFVIGAGEIDLSFPSVIAFSGLRLRRPVQGLRARLAGRGRRPRLGLLVGLVNGLLVAVSASPPSSRRLARSSSGRAWRRCSRAASPMRCAAPSSPRSGSGSSAGRFAGAQYWSGSTQLPMQALWTALIVVFLWFILNRHRFGEHVLFIGDSNDVSRVVGIDVEREKIKLFTLMGALAALAAIFLTLENKNFFGNQGQGYLLIAIAAVLIGGTSIFGGRATLVGTVFGCFIIA